MEPASTVTKSARRWRLAWVAIASLAVGVGLAWMARSGLLGGEDKGTGTIASGRTDLGNSGKIEGSNSAKGLDDPPRRDAPPQSVPDHPPVSYSPPPVPETTEDKSSIEDSKSPSSVTDSQPDLSAQFTPEVIEAFAKRLQAVEDQLRKHVPTGTSSEAFFSSLGDDGMAWDKICRFGGRIFAMLEAAGASDREAHPDFSSAAIAEITRYDAASPQVYPHESDIKQLKAALDVIWPELDQVNRIELPRRVFMIGTLAERSQTEGGLFDGDVVSVFNFLKGVAVTMTAQARIGQTDIALQHVAHISQLCYSLVPTRLLEALMLARIRGEIARLLLGLAEARVLPIDKLIAIRDSLAALPLTLEFISVGETLNGLSHLGASGSSASFLREWVSGPWAKQGPQFLEEALGMFEMFSRGLDRSTPVGKLCSPLPFQVSIADALAACKEVPLLTNLITRSAQEFAILHLIGTHMHESIPYPPPMLGWGEISELGKDGNPQRMASNLWMFGKMLMRYGPISEGSVMEPAPYDPEVERSRMLVPTTHYWRADSGSDLFPLNSGEGLRDVIVMLPLMQLFQDDLVPRDEDTEPPPFPRKNTQVEYRLPGTDTWLSLDGRYSRKGDPKLVIAKIPCNARTGYVIASTSMWSKDRD